MTQPPDHDTMTLAGLAAANGPWLAVRLQRLAGLAELPLPLDVVEGAVDSTSLVLGQILEAEGRPLVNADPADDPAVVLGREQAQAHRQAGLSMPDSLRVQRLLRRAYDDLVRESWVEDRESRSRAHEDVERFFERALIGLAETWTGQISPAAPPLSASDENRTALLAQREDQLRRALEAARKLTEMVRQSRERGAALEAQAQAEVQALHTRIRELETERTQLGHRLSDQEAAQAAQAAQAGAGPDPSQILKELAEARTEASSAQAACAKLEEAAQTLRGQAETQTKNAEALRAELRQARQDHAALASDAEAMRARLAETGSRLAEVKRAEEGELQARLQQADSALVQARERSAALEAKLRQVGQDGQAHIQEIQDLKTRLAEESLLLIELRELLARQARDAEQAAEQAAIQAEARAAELEARSQDLAERLRQAEALVIGTTERLTQTQAELARAQAAAEQAALHGMTQAEESAIQRQDLAERLREAEAQLISTAEQLAQAQEQQARAERGRNDAERRAADAMASSGEAALEARAQARVRLEELASARDASTALLAEHLALTPDAVAALDPAGRFLAWNAPFPALFDLDDALLAGDIEAALPQLCAALQHPEPFVARLRELLADPALSEDGLALVTTRGQTLIFRSISAISGTATAAGNGAAGRLLNFRDESLVRDMESLVREIEGITRYELGQSLTAFIHLPQELLDDPAVSPEQARKLEIIRDSGYRIVNTVNMAVDTFRMERGLYRMPPGRSLDLAVVLRRAAKDAAQLSASRHVDLQLLLDQAPLPPDAILTGPGDPLLAHALTLNLLRDALEAAPRNTSVSATLREDDIDDCLRLDISRQGTLTTDQAAGYFDKPLGQEAPGAGPGQGLQRARYSAQLIAKSLGGSLNVSASPENGTTLTLRLPRG